MKHETLRKLCEYFDENEANGDGSAYLDIVAVPSILNLVWIYTSPLEIFLHSVTIWLAIFNWLLAKKIN